MFDSVITDDIFEEKTKKIRNDDNITIRTKESLHYYEVYKENFKIPEFYSGKNSCSDCNTELNIDSKFCRMCGKFPLRNYFLYFFGFFIKILLQPLQQK